MYQSREDGGGRADLPAPVHPAAQPRRGAGGRLQEAAGRKVLRLKGRPEAGDCGAGRLWRGRAGQADGLHAAGRVGAESSWLAFLGARWLGVPEPPHQKTTPKWSVADACRIGARSDWQNIVRKSGKLPALH